VQLVDLHDAVVLLLLVDGPVVVTGGEGDGDQACFFWLRRECS
jgi:hypothetical protein